MKCTAVGSVPAWNGSGGVCVGCQSLCPPDCGHGGSERELQSPGESERELRKSPYDYGNCQEIRRKWGDSLRSADNPRP